MIPPITQIHATLHPLHEIYSDPVQQPLLQHHQKIIYRSIIPTVRHFLQQGLYVKIWDAWVGFFFKNDSGGDKAVQ